LVREPRTSIATGITGWRPALALLLASIATVVTPERTHAQNFPTSVVQIGAWTLVATAVDRTFQACVVRRIQHDGFALNVGLNVDGTQFLAIAATHWTLVARRTYPTSLKIGPRAFDVTGTATDTRVLMLQPPADFFAALKSGQQLNVTVNQQYFPVDLDGVEKAVARLPGCVKEYTGSTLPAPPPPPERSARQQSAPPKPAPVDLSMLIVKVKPADPVYPVEARRAKQQGKVLMRIQFGTTGIPEVITVDQSSGYSALDNSAIDSVKAMRIEPYIVDGKPTPTAVLVPIRFLLN
jgi:TonB family protein